MSELFPPVWFVASITAIVIAINITARIVRLRNRRSTRVLREYAVIRTDDIGTPTIYKATNCYPDDGFFWLVDERTEPESDVFVLPVASVKSVTVTPLK